MALFDQTISKKFLTDQFPQLVKDSAITFDQLFKETTESLHSIINNLEQKKTNVEINLSLLQLLFFKSLLQVGLSQLKKLNKSRPPNEYSILTSIINKLGFLEYNTQSSILNKLEVCTLIRIFEEIIETGILTGESDAASQVLELKFYLCNSTKGYFANYVLKKAL